jgi:hypothetical protein
MDMSSLYIMPLEDVNCCMSGTVGELLHVRNRGKLLHVTQRGGNYYLDKFVSESLV